MKVWNAAKRFGFIVPYDGSEDIFVHYRALVGAEALMPGDCVTFETEYDDQRGRFRAAGVYVTSGAGMGTTAAEATTERRKPPPRTWHWRAKDAGHLDVPRDFLPGPAPESQ